MPTIRLGLAILLGMLAVVPPAGATRVELAGRVTASRTVLSQRRVGEPRYVAVSDLFYRDRSAYVEVLDLVTQTVIQVVAKRSVLEKRFGVARGGAIAAPQGEVVLYRDGVVGLALTEAASGATHRVWYVELDGRTGRVARAARLAALGAGDQLQIVGVDPVGDAAWFAITSRAGRGRALALRRLDLASLDATDEHQLALPARTGGVADHAVQVHAAADFARFAVVEYVEDGVGMAPGHVYVIDLAAGAELAVAAPPTTYGVAFSPDGKYLYLGSAQRGTISRVDLAARRIDKQVAAPRFLHHLVVSPSGTRLFAFASSASYASYDLPDLRARVDAAHPAGVAAAMVQLSGNGIASLDGAFFVVPEAEDRRAPAARDRAYVIARLVE